MTLELPGTYIPAYGAVGACLGSGAGQLTAVGVMWAIGIYIFKIELPWLQVTKIALISVLASLTAHAHRDIFAADIGPLSSAGVLPWSSFFGLFYLLRVLEPEDHDRFKVLTGILPKRVARPLNTFLTLLIRPEFAE